MYDSVAVKEGDCFGDVGQDGEDLIRGEVFLFFHEFEKVAIKARLHNKINILFVVEKTVQFYNVGMIQIHLNLDLPQEWLFNILLLYYRFGDGFQRTDKPTHLMSSYSSLLARWFIGSVMHYVFLCGYFYLVKIFMEFFGSAPLCGQRIMNCAYLLFQ